MFFLLHGESQKDRRGGTCKACDVTFVAHCCHIWEKKKEKQGLDSLMLKSDKGLLKGSATILNTMLNSVILLFFLSALTSQIPPQSRRKQDQIRLPGKTGRLKYLQQEMLNFNGILNKLLRRLRPPKATGMTENACKLTATQITVRNL